MNDAEMLSTTLLHAQSWAAENDRSRGSADYVCVYKPVDGVWNICDDDEDVPAALHVTTEGYLLVWADGRVGIASGK